MRLLFLASSSSKQKLALFYLANEVIQNCRRKNARIFQESFKKILPRAIEIVGLVSQFIIRL